MGSPNSPTIHMNAPILVENLPPDMWASFISKAFSEIFRKFFLKNQKRKKKTLKMQFFANFLVSKSPTLHNSAPILVANQPSDLWPSFIQKAFLKIFAKKIQKIQKIQNN